MKMTFWLSISACFLLSCSSSKDEVRGRPPGIVTSEQEDALRAKANKAREQNAQQRKARVDADLLAISDQRDKDGDLLDVWNEEEEIGLWDGDEEKEGALKYAPVFEVDGWPYQEPSSTFRLLWGARKGEIEVYAKPDLRTDPIGLVEFEKDEEIIWDNSMVAIVSPAPYVAKDNITLEGFRVTTGYLTGDESFSTVIPEGETIYLLLYAGDGNCFMALGIDVVTTTCPTRDQFGGRYVGLDAREQMQPLARVWWVHFGGAEGAWIPLDNNFIVEIY